MYHLLHKGFTFVQNNADATTTRKLIDYLFDYQDQFTEELLLEYTLDNFLNELAALVSAITVPVPLCRKSTNSPSVLLSIVKPPQTTPLATTGSTQSALTESQAHLLSPPMGWGSTGPRTGALPNGWTSWKCILDCKMYDNRSSL